MSTLDAFFKNCSIAVTGAAGTIGQELVRQLLQYSPKEVRALDNNESALFSLEESYRDEPGFQAFLADVRDSRTKAQARPPSTAASTSIWTNNRRSSGAHRFGCITYSTRPPC